MLGEGVGSTFGGFYKLASNQEVTVADKKKPRKVGTMF